MTDFESLYNNIEEYRSFRDDKNKENEYEIWTNWKVKNLIDVLDKKIDFRNVMEIGCAFGVVLNKFSQKCNIKNIIGLDIAKANTIHGSKMFPHIKFITGTIEKDSLFTESGIIDKRFDIIILCDIIEHIPDELKFMQKVKKISNYVVIDLPLEKSYSTRNRNYGVDDVSGHLRSYNLAEGLELIKNAGFQVINYKTELVYHDKECYNLFKEERKARLLKKPLLKRIFWTFFYFTEDLMLINFNRYHVKMKGCNLFALLKSTNE